MRAIRVRGILSLHLFNLSHFWLKTTTAGRKLNRLYRVYIGMRRMVERTQVFIKKGLI